jgi:hypothetical protein
MNEKQFDPELAKTLFPEPKPTKRLWERRRNLARLILASARDQIQQVINQGVLVGPERTQIDFILSTVNSLLEDWDSESEASKQKFGKR